MLTSNIISFVVAISCVANVERGKVTFLMQNIHSSQNVLCPNFKVIKNERFKMDYPVSSPSSTQYKHNHLLW